MEKVQRLSGYWVLCFTPLWNGVKCITSRYSLAPLETVPYCVVLHIQPYSLKRINMYCEGMGFYYLKNNKMVESKKVH